MPVFDPNQLGGPSPVTMSGLMNQGLPSRAPMMSPPGMGDGAPPMPPPMTMPQQPGQPGVAPMSPPGGMVDPTAGMAPTQASVIPGGMPGGNQTTRVQEAADDAAIQAALQAAQNDPDAATKTLAQSGHQGAAMKLQQAARQHRQREVRKRADMVAQQEASYRVGERLLSSVNDDATFAIVREILGRFMPQAAQMLGSSFAEARPRIQKWLKQAQPAVAHLREQHGALETMQTALRTGDKSQWSRAAGTILGSARDAGQWQTLLAQLRQAGAPAEVLNQFDTVFSDDAAQRAKSRGGSGSLQGDESGPSVEDMGLLLGKLG